MAWFSKTPPPVPTDAVWVFPPIGGEEAVLELYGRWCAELRRLFAAHAHEVLPKAVAARGLQISQGAAERPLSRL